jgi:hypothetical protein
MVTEALVARAGPIDTLVCHTDFDGLCSAAKWIRGGQEPYEGADDDARAIDTRLGTPSERALPIDRALRARPRDDGLRGMIVSYLVHGAVDRELLKPIAEAAEELRPREDSARELARGYSVRGEIAFVQVPDNTAAYDKTLLLLLGQERARIAVVCDAAAVTIAARFDSGVDLLQMFSLEGGMPTVVSLGPEKLSEVLSRLGYAPGAA